MTPPPRHNGERIDPALARPVPLPPGFATASSDFSTGFRAGISCRALVICRTNARWDCAFSLATRKSSVARPTSSPCHLYHTLNHLFLPLNTLRPPHILQAQYSASYPAYGNCPLSSSKLRSGSPYHSQFANRDACQKPAIRLPGYAT